MACKKRSRVLRCMLIAFLCRAAITSCMAETFPANSRILFVGGAAGEYMNCFMGIYAGDATVNFLNIPADRGQTAIRLDENTGTYVYAQIVDNTNLVSGTLSTNFYALQTKGPAVDNYRVVTNTYSTTADQLFIKQEVEQ